MKSVRIAVAAALLSPLGLAGLAQVPKPAPNAAAPPSAESKLPGISKYRTWQPINAEPYRASTTVSALCAAPNPARTAEMIRKERERNPHADYHVRVYVTPSAREAFRWKNADLPVGTTVVKEKLPSATATAPELLTVMVKRAKGYEPQGGDWQYYVLDGTGTKILADSRLKLCRDCHQSRKAQGYLFRDYVTYGEQSPTKDQGK
jgi:hypothetical protein